MPSLASPAVLLVILRMLLRENSGEIRHRYARWMDSGWACAHAAGIILISDKRRGNMRGRPGEPFSRFFPPRRWHREDEKGRIRRFGRCSRRKKKYRSREWSRRSEGSEISIGRWAAQRATPEIRCLNAERIDRANWAHAVYFEGMVIEEYFMILARQYRSFRRFMCEFHEWSLKNVCILFVKIKFCRCYHIEISKEFLIPKDNWILNDEYENVWMKMSRILLLIESGWDVEFLIFVLHLWCPKKKEQLYCHRSFDLILYEKRHIERQ